MAGAVASIKEEYLLPKVLASCEKKPEELVDQQLPSTETSLNDVPVANPNSDEKKSEEPVDQQLSSTETLLNDLPVANSNSDQTTESPSKKMKIDKKAQKKLWNKKRPKLPRVPDKLKLCRSYWTGIPETGTEPCKFMTGEKTCRYSHDVKAFLAAKLEDISDRCHNFETFGHCAVGVMCRFSGAHFDSESMTSKIVDLSLNSKETKQKEINQLDKSVQHSLRKRKYDFSNADAALKKLYKTNVTNGNAANGVSEPRLGPADDTDIIKLRLSEKKKIDWNDKLYLAPLTTLGNLPFRRICKNYGADVTCGEMALASNILQGQTSEWALVQRHESETLFGVQLCGCNPVIMTKTAQVLQEKIDVDFIDINMGCPIDIIFQRGMGSALMRKRNQLKQVVTAMNNVLNIPLTLKMRAGIHTKQYNAHEIISEVKLWDVSMVTVHGRSKEQRYIRTADWDYVDQCAKAADPMPLFGSGDILTYDDYVQSRKNTNISGVMIARGALIKPWIFTEIKEQREWDISSMERMEILKNYTNFGLEHWGSDEKGVETTRRFLLEWLSFLYRYIPVGILEAAQTMNMRPEAYKGRNDLETLMASHKVEDWVKISEMVLGKVPDNFEFVPKHKANSWT